MGILDIFKNNTTKNTALQGIINDKDTFLVDVRSKGEFSTGSARGSSNIPLTEINARINRFKGKSNIVVFCRSGNRSGQAKAILEQNGIRNVHNGGTWKQVDQLIEK